MQLRPERFWNQMDTGKLERLAIKKSHLLVSRLTLPPAKMDSAPAVCYYNYASTVCHLCELAKSRFGD